MFDKDFEMPLAIQKLLSLEKRLNAGHCVKPEVTSELARRLAGHKGEHPSCIIFNNSPRKNTLFSTTYDFYPRLFIS